LSLAAAALQSGCDGTAGEPLADPGAEEAIIHRTIVVNHDDGTTTVRRLDISAAESARDIELRRLISEGKYTPAVLRDNSCAGSSMWLFNINGDELCLYQDPKSDRMSIAELWRWDPSGPLFEGPSWYAKIRKFYGGAEFRSEFNWAGGCCSSPGNCSEGGTPDSVIGCGPWIPPCTEYYGAWTYRDPVSQCVSVATRVGLQAYSHF
jgi:hypothetical protein